MLHLRRGIDGQPVIDPWPGNDGLRKLAHEFNANLRGSFSAGAEALNIATIASCGPVPVTA